jgi:polyvinyl alcohol dehydrogenase (cytochrome)
MRHVGRIGLALVVAGALVTPVAGRAEPSPPPGHAGSQWGCGDWGMYGRTLSRSFSTEGCADAITAATAATLVPAWTLPFRPPLDLEDQATFTASPTVVGETVYIGGWDGVFYALDKATGAVRWTFETPPAPGATFGPVVSSAAVVDHKGERLVLFGAGPWLFALADRATTATVEWQTYVGALPGEDDPAEVESSPVVWNKTVYVGMDVHDQHADETGGVRGGLLALNLENGAVKWKYEAELYGRDTAPPIERLASPPPGSGCGGVWSSPVVDTRRGRIYVGTANCYDARPGNQLPLEEIAAVDAATGAPIWRFFPHQPGQNQDLEPGAERNDDVDFGATPNLFADGERLGAGNKDGRYYALDPDDGRELVRTAQVSTPAPDVGGFIGSTAVHGRRVFGGTAIGMPPSYHSIDAGSGAVRWQMPIVPTYAASAATAEVVFAGALDGVLKAFHADTGAVLWASPLLGPISSGPAIAGDMVFIGSGTSSSDLCAKDDPYSAACFLLFDNLLGQQGGVHAFRLALP